MLLLRQNPDSTAPELAKASYKASRVTGDWSTCLGDYSIRAAMRSLKKQGRITVQRISGVRQYSEVEAGARRPARRRETTISRV